LAGADLVADYLKRPRLFDDDRSGLSFREIFTPMREGPLPPRPYRSGRGGSSINQSQPPVVTGSVWSAADASTNAMTLSNGGVTVTPPGVGLWRSIRSSTGKISGKLYVELYDSVVTSGYNVVFGVASPEFNIVGLLGSSDYSTGIWLGSTNYVSDSFVSNYTSNLLYTFAQDDVVGVAIDFDAGSIWVSKNNVWSNSSDPATGSLPIISFDQTIVGLLFVGISFNGPNNGVWTLQSNTSSQKYAPPSGFSAWDDTPAMSPEAAAYLARTTGGNAGGNAANIAALIDGLVANGVWAKLDCLYVLAQQNATDAQLNLIGTSYPLTPIGAITFTQYRGFSGFGPNTSYFDTGFNPTASSLNYIQNSASFGVWTNFGLLEAAAVFSNGTAGGTSHLYPYFTDQNFYARVNSPSTPGVLTPASAGLYVGDRPSSSAVNLYWNGANHWGIQTDASQTLVSNNFRLGGGIVGYSGQQFAAAFIGASLGDAGQLALYNRLRTYMTAVGVPLGEDSPDVLPAEGTT
jgi:hypothetical protein